MKQVQQPTVLNGATGANAQPTTNYTYTSVGLPYTVTDPSGVLVQYSYDSSGNRTLTQIDPNGLNVTKSYGPDAVWKIATVTTGRGNTTTYSYDADRRVTAVTGPASTCTKTENIWQGGLVTKVRNATVRNPDESTDKNWQVWGKQYTANDLIYIETDPEGATTETDYDSVDRPQYIRQWIDSSTTRVTYNVYDAAGELKQVYRGWGSPDQILYAQYAYSPDGRKIQEKDANQNPIDYGYDGYGRLHTTTFADSSYEQYGYDNNGNITSKLKRDGQTITYQPDALNRETSRTVPANPSFPGDHQRVYSATYDLASRKWDTTVDGQTLQHRYDTDPQATGTPRNAERIVVDETSGRAWYTGTQTIITAASRKSNDGYAFRISPSRYNAAANVGICSASASGDFRERSSTENDFAASKVPRLFCTQLGLAG